MATLRMGSGMWPWAAHGPLPCSAELAVQRARSMIGRGGQYVAGAGDYRPEGGSDEPWTTRDGQTGADGAGFAIAWCYKLPRLRPGFNRGGWATASDELGCTSALEDARHGRELFEVVTVPALGALLVHPTFSVAAGGVRRTSIGRIGVVIGIGRAAGWDPARPRYELLDIAHCHGPAGRRPAVIASDGAPWSQHDAQWSKPPQRSRLLRVRA